MTKKELRDRLEKAEKLRDQWCAEYTFIRKQLRKLMSKLERR